MQVVRRWKIRKIGHSWFVFSTGTRFDSQCRYINQYDTFEAARHLVARSVDLYHNVFAKLTTRKN